MTTTEQKIQNRKKIVELALKIYDAKPDENSRREMFKAYADHIAFTQTAKGQLEWIEILEAKVKELQPTQEAQMIRKYHEWKEITSRGTSGDQVADILESWFADANNRLKNEHSLLDEIVGLQRDKWALNDRVKALIEKNKQMRDAIAGLRGIIGPDGNFSICKANRDLMGMDDIRRVGKVLEELSKALEEAC